MMRADPYGEFQTDTAQISQPAYMRSGTPIPSNDNPVCSTFAVKSAKASLDERISPSDLRIGQAS